MKRKIIDISVPMHEGMPIYEGNPPFTARWAMSIEHGDNVNLTEMDEGVHSGTHIDAPYHFIEGGRKIDELPLTLFFLNVHVVECTQQVISSGLIQSVEMKWGEGIIFKTSNSSLYDRPFTRNFVYVDEEGARALVQKGAAVVGIDYLSIEQFGSPTSPAHHTLLSREIPIIEGLCLAGVEEGKYTLAVFPIRLRGREAAPARAVLFQPAIDDIIELSE